MPLKFTYAVARRHDKLTFFPSCVFGVRNVGNHTTGRLLNDPHFLMTYQVRIIRNTLLTTDFSINLFLRHLNSSKVKALIQLKKTLFADKNNPT